MNFLKLFFLITGIISGLILIFIFTISQSDEQSVLSNKIGNSMPGSFDAVKNKIIGFFSILFAVSVLLISVGEYRGKKKKDINLPEVVKDTNNDYE